MNIARKKRGTYTLGILGGLAMAGLALAAAACGGSSSASSTSTAAPAQPSAAAPTQAAATPTEAAANTGATGGTAAGTVNVATDGVKRFVDGNGLSLYLFKPDQAGSGKSACNGGCATAWPPLTIAAGTMPVAGAGVDGLDVITRDDGTTQVTYDGLPLYHYAGDAAPGDTAGKDIPNWSLATP